MRHANWLSSTSSFVSSVTTLDGVISHRQKVHSVMEVRHTCRNKVKERFDGSY